MTVGASKQQYFSVFITFVNCCLVRLFKVLFQVGIGQKRICSVRHLFGIWRIKSFIYSELDAICTGLIEVRETTHFEIIWDDFHLVDPEELDCCQPYEVIQTGSMTDELLYYTLL